MRRFQPIHRNKALISSIVAPRPNRGPVVLPLSDLERRFILFTLRDLTRTAEAVLHHPAPGQYTSPWTRQDILDRLAVIVTELRSGKPAIAISQLDRRLLIEAIQGSRYFAAMRDGDPNLTPAAARAADALRLRLAAAFSCKIAKVPLGEGRKRLALVE